MRKPALLLTLASLTFWLAACAPDGEQPGAGEGTAQPEATSAEAGATTEDAEAPSATEDGESVGGAAAGTPASQGGGDAASGTGTPGGQGATGGGQAELVASVNGKPILLAEFQRQAWDTQRYFVDQGGIDPSSPEGQQQLLYLRRQVLSDMINQALLEQAAAEMKISATAEEAETSLQSYIEQIGGEAEFEKSLTETGATRDEVLEMERASLIGKKMLEQIAADVPETAEFVHARHILCETEADCQAALARLEAGEDFATVAREVSQDETTKDRGGDLDWVTRGTSPSQKLEEAMFALEAGERSAVIQTDFGFHVIELIERDPERALDEAQRVQLKEKKLAEWQAERRAQADIVIYVEDLKADLEGGAGTMGTPMPSGAGTAAPGAAASPTPAG
jgi:parvulin-like peptidyl-prolyl isomerase